MASFPDLDGASVFVTGGGSGIGAALTAGFLAQGAQVSFAQRSDATAFCNEMERIHGRRPLFLPCDITDTDALRGAIAQAADRQGPVTVLINNAANDARHRIATMTEAYWDSSQALNLKAYVFACQAVLPGMVAAGHGAIVNLSSISYMMGNDEYISYATANAGITGMTRSLAREFGPHGVRVNTLAPGWVMTARQLDGPARDPTVRAAHLDRQCLKTHLKPEDIAGPVLFLASEASAMVTGQLLAVDGGVVATG